MLLVLDFFSSIYVISFIELVTQISYSWLNVLCVSTEDPQIHHQRVKNKKNLWFIIRRTITPCLMETGPLWRSKSLCNIIIGITMSNYKTKITMPFYSFFPLLCKAIKLAQLLWYQMLCLILIWNFGNFTKCIISLLKRGNTVNKIPSTWECGILVCSLWFTVA